MPAPTAASAAAFFTSYRERPPAARDALALAELVEQFTDAVAEQAAVPAAGPTFDEAEPELRRALEALPASPFAAHHGGNFEYYAAWRAKRGGDAVALQAAVANPIDPESTAAVSLA